MPRPSLSGAAGRGPRRRRASVAGVDAPAFVERPSLAVIRQSIPRVAGVDAPAFVERSRSAAGVAPPMDVSPGLMPRPSLSDIDERRRVELDRRVAGVDAPAFVERILSQLVGNGYGRVAGVDAPAFVERHKGAFDTTVAYACRRG